MLDYFLDHAAEISALVIAVINIGIILKRPFLWFLNHIIPPNYNFNIQYSKSLCIGRKRELKELYKNILHKKSTFIYGGPGIGKTTIVIKVLTSMNRRLLKRLYPGGTISYDFYADSSEESACKKIFTKTVSKDSKDIDYDTIINQKRCLIYLEGCERTSNLKKVIETFSNSVFIITSRDYKQKYVFPEISEIKIESFNERNSLRLLMKTTNNQWKKNKKAIEYLKLISAFFGHLPLAIQLAGIDLDYSKIHPKAYYENLKIYGVDLQLVYNDDERMKSEKTNIKLLLDRATGLSQDSKSINLSSNAKRMLGLIGCLNNSYSHLIFFNSKEGKDLEKSKALLELNNYGLIEYNETTEIINPKHALIYKYAKNNAKALMNDTENYSELHNIIDFLVSLFLGAYQGAEFLSEELYENFELHLYNAVKSLITLTDDYSESIQDDISQACFILTRAGLYNEFVEINEIIKNNSKFNTRDINYVSAFSSYLHDMNDFDYLIKINLESCIYYKNRLGEKSYEYIVACSNLGYHYIMCRDYQTALSVLKKCYTESLVYKESDKKGLIPVINTNIAEAFMGLKEYDKAEELLIKCFNELMFVEGEKNDITLDTQLSLVKALICNNKIQDGIDLLSDCYQKRVKTFTLRDTKTLTILNEIGELLLDKELYQFAKQIYQFLVLKAISIHGQEHVITKRYIKNMQVCEGKESSKRDKKGLS